jgi:uncharacterized coiled-coil protein SlyX
MSRQITVLRILKFISLAGLVFLMGCALNPKRISGLEDRLSRADAEIAKLKEEVSQSNQKVEQLESGLRETSSDLTSLETKLNANTKENYLRVSVPILNIRTSPSTATNNVIAKAEQGAYLRKVTDTDENGQWIKVEFLIDDYPYIGYIYNDQEFVKEEVYDAITFGRIYNRKLIKYQWETEAAMEMRSNDFKTLGVYIKPLESFTIGQVPQQCARNNLEGIMAVEIETPAGFAPQMDIKLFDKSNVILYSAVLPLQSIELPDDLGRS